jgi:hypothetical protein
MPHVALQLITNWSGQQDIAMSYYSPAPILLWYSNPVIFLYNEKQY